MCESRLTRGHRWFAALYPRIVAGQERRRWSKVRPRIMGDVRGHVLEIGVGAGTSLPFYPAEAQVVATEPDPHMLRRAQQRLAELGRTNIELRQAPAEALPFEDHSFDHVVCSWMLCTVDDLDRTLAEVRRVLKPEGTFRFMEHVRNDSNGFWAAAQAVIAPAWRWAGAGCRLNQQTERAITEAGFRIEWIEHVQTWLQPVIYGAARPA